MTNDSVHHIIQLTLDIDSLAESIFHALSLQADTPQLRDFFRTMALEEGEHVLFWEQLLAKSAEFTLPMVFEDPEETFAQLTQTREDALRLRHKVPSLNTEELMLESAFKLEFLLLHPAFEVLFYLAQESFGLPSPEESYQEHIGHLVNVFTSLSGEKRSMELAASMLVHIWKQNRLTAKRLLKLHKLSYFLPACMSCGKIRLGDKWITAEEFMRESFDSQISHGICPQCSDVLYPDLFKKGEAPP